MKCPYCGLENPPDAMRCDCGYNFTTAGAAISNVAVRGNRYPALRIISNIYRVAAVAVGVLALAIVIIAIGKQDFFLMTAGFIGGLVGVISNCAAAELIRVFLDIEENTRYTFWTVAKQQTIQKAPPV